MTKVYGLTNLQFGVPSGIARNIRYTASDLGVTPAEFLRACWGMAPATARSRYGLTVRLPGPEQIAVTGTHGRIVGTLQALRDGLATIDGPETADSRDRVLPIVVCWSDLIGEGSATRLSPARKKRLPGRRRSIKVARAQAALADLGDTGAGVE